MKNKGWVSLISLLLVISLTACSKQASTSKNDTQANTGVSTSVTKEEVVESDTQRIGSTDYGYIDIPKDWIPFTDVSGGDSLQYTDGTGYNIVTMNAYTREKLGLTEDDEFTAEMVANQIAYLWTDNSGVSELWGDKATVSENEAFQVNVILESEQWLVTWVFKHEETIYMISYEGSEESFNTFVPYIEETWSSFQ